MENCAGFNEGLATLPGEVGKQFIALLRRFDRTQGPVCGGKVGSRHLKSRLDPATWILPCEINAIETPLIATRDLPQTRMRSACSLSLSCVDFTAQKAPFAEEESGNANLKVASIRRRGYFHVR